MIAERGRCRPPTTNRSSALRRWWTTTFDGDTRREALSRKRVGPLKKWRESLRDMMAG
jgi:hypothetical protein